MFYNKLIYIPDIKVKDKNAYSNKTMPQERTQGLYYIIDIKKPPTRGGFVPRTGIEPAHPCEYKILSLARLPIPPSGHSLL
jgi:hypothetical protein